MIVKKAKRLAPVLNEYIASKILGEIDNLTPNQIEYIVTRGGRAVIPEISRLYNASVKLGREDLVSILRYTWNTQGPKGFLECPRCGFKAISPDRSCIVCGTVVTDEYLRKALGFSEKFEVFLKSASVAELNEVLNHGYVLVGEKGVYNPRSSRARIENPVVYIVYLRKEELSRIVEEVNTRELPI